MEETSKQQCRRAYLVIGAFKAFADAEEGTPVLIDKGHTLFADPEFWEDSTIVKFTWGGIGQIWFYVDRATFRNSTEPANPSAG